jgi:hypothetical protein
MPHLLFGAVRCSVVQQRVKEQNLHITRFESQYNITCVNQNFLLLQEIVNII